MAHTLSRSALLLLCALSGGDQSNLNVVVSSVLMLHPYRCPHVAVACWLPMPQQKAQHVVGNIWCGRLCHFALDGGSRCDLFRVIGRNWRNRVRLRFCNLTVFRHFRLASHAPPTSERRPACQPSLTHAARSFLHSFGKKGVVLDARSSEMSGGGKTAAGCRFGAASAANQINATDARRPKQAARLIEVASACHSREG